MKSNQEVFNFVALMLIKQGKPSVDEATGMCMYRSVDGCKCAAGWLIPDDKYTPAMEKTVISAVIDNFGLDLDVDSDFLEVLQGAHDDSAVVYNQITSEYRINKTHWLNEWKNIMRNIALCYNLNDSVLDS